MKTKKGFTLVELVIVIAIVIVLSVVSVPIYRNYVDKAKFSEAYALFGTILSAQRAYYSEYGNFYDGGSYGKKTSYDRALGIDARGNKHFSLFCTSSNKESTLNYAAIPIPEDLRIFNNRSYLVMYFHLNKAATISDNVV